MPTHITVSREGLPEGVTDPPGFTEDPDWVQMGSTRIAKPFVEKPVSGEDHNVYIYYPSSMVWGGTMCVCNLLPVRFFHGRRGGEIGAGSDVGLSLGGVIPPPWYGGPQCAHTHLSAHYPSLNGARGRGDRGLGVMVMGCLFFGNRQGGVIGHVGW